MASAFYKLGVACAVKEASDLTDEQKAIAAGYIAHGGLRLPASILHPLYTRTNKVIDPKVAQKIIKHYASVMKSRNIPEPVITTTAELAKGNPFMEAIIKRYVGPGAAIPSKNIAILPGKVVGNPQTSAAMYQLTAHPSVLAHELSHLAGPLQRRGWRVLNTLGRLGGRYGAWVAPLFQAITDPGSTEFNIATYAPVVSMLPVLHEEARASIDAQKTIKKLFGPAEARKALGKLVPAFGTYLALAASPLLTAYVVKKVKEK